MANALHLHDRHPLNKHQDSIIASLNHRLAVAKASHNANLVAVLEREQQQVAPKAASSVVHSGRNWWQTMTRSITDKLFGGSVLQVVEIVDGRDRWWVASDPRTGQLVYADSEAELRLWIEENYQGK
ncbi:hypothetical protein [Stenomitos frigidus]|nr:hypothetical protein [Stenomitos frigidus]